MLAAVRRTALALVLVLLAACDSGGEATTTASDPRPTTTAATTTTVDLEAECARVAEDSVALLEEFVTALDGMSASQLTDPALWPSGLAELQTRGRALDDRVMALGCDLGAIQQVVLARVPELEGDSAVARLLLEALSRAG